MNKITLNPVDCGLNLRKKYNDLYSILAEVRILCFQTV